MVRGRIDNFQAGNQEALNFSPTSSGSRGNPMPIEIGDENSEAYL